jgi:hypothetical protein
MSSQFNYEIDENQIKALLTNAKAAYTEDAWLKFAELDQSRDKKISHYNSGSKSFNLKVSQSVILPIVFVVLIGGLSAMLFSFIDFKKKETVVEEIPYTVTNVVNNTPKAEATPIATPVKKDTILVQKNDSILLHNENTNEQVATLENKEKISETVTEKLQPIKEEVKKEEVVTKKPTEIKKKLNKKKVKTEDILPTINAPIDLNASNDIEPELNLK